MFVYLHSEYFNVKKKITLNFVIKNSAISNNFSNSVPKYSGILSFF